ncbi:septum formation protein Maf [Fusibacter sp. 3D3]|nr:septum formation protein Maf [Fusibacter sp. 3D3]
MDEKTTFYEKPEQIVMGLSFEKTYQVAQLEPDAIIIGSDTIVYLNEVLGKPEDKAEAYRMLRKLSGKTHDVYTGIAVICESQKIKRVDYVKTKVDFKDLSEAEINAYIETGEPLDKAGAYAIQGQGALLVNQIQGDYFSVMGLPLSKLNQIMIDDFRINLLTKEGL